MLEFFLMELSVFKPQDLSCDTNGCTRGGPHLVETLSGIVLRLCPGCYDAWWRMFGRWHRWHRARPLHETVLRNVGMRELEGTTRS